MLENHYFESCLIEKRPSCANLQGILLLLDQAIVSSKVKVSAVFFEV